MNINTHFSFAAFALSIVFANTSAAQLAMSPMEIDEYLMNFDKKEIIYIRSSLPSCTGDPLKYNNCFGGTSQMGDILIGEFVNGQLHGRGMNKPIRCSGTFGEFKNGAIQDLKTVVSKPEICGPTSPPQWQSQVAWWRIYESNQLGCSAESNFKDGTKFVIDLEGPNQTIGFKFSNSKWNSIKPGETYAIRIVFDGQKNWNGSMSGAFISGTPALTMASIKEAFFTDFMNYNTITLQYKNEKLGSFSLQSSSAALSELRKCHNSVLAEANSRSAGTNIGTTAGNTTTGAPQVQPGFIGRWECRLYDQGSGSYDVATGSGFVETYTKNSFNGKGFSITDDKASSHGGREWVVKFDDFSREIGELSITLVREVVGGKPREVLFRTGNEDHVYVCNRR